MLDEKTLKHTQMLVSRAKIGMLETHPFYAHILTRLRFDFPEQLPMAAISATDGRAIYINASKYGALPKNEQLSVLAHELLHCLDGHIWRRGDRNPLWANIAQDIYLYHVLQQEKFAILCDNEKALIQILKKVAKGTFGLSDFVGMFWEQIYDVIAPPPQPQSGEDQQDQQDQGACGHCYQPSPASESTKETQEQWKQWIREAGIYAKMAGAQPGHWNELVEAATPRVPFETRFQESLKRSLGGDQTYDSFNRRYLHQGEYFPSEIVEQMGETVAVVDTSGSRSTEDIAYALGVFRAWRDQHPCKFHLVECDYSNQGWRTFEEWDDLPVKFEIHGRGGTHFAPPFEEVKSRQLEPALLIFITDGFNYGDFAPKPPYEVLWVLTGEYNKEFKPPYGECCIVDSH